VPRHTGYYEPVPVRKSVEETLVVNGDQELEATFALLDAGVDAGVG
jgi:hypothetical protein